jgi:hypothetical protein
MPKPEVQAQDATPHQQVVSSMPLLVKTIVNTALSIQGGTEEEGTEITRQIAAEYGPAIMRDAVSVNPLEAEILWRGALSMLCTVELFLRAQARKRN